MLFIRFLFESFIVTSTDSGAFNGTRITCFKLSSISGESSAPFDCLLVFSNALGSLHSHSVVQVDGKGTTYSEQSISVIFIRLSAKAYYLLPLCCALTAISSIPVTVCSVIDRITPFVPCKFVSAFFNAMELLWFWRPTMNSYSEVYDIILVKSSENFFLFIPISDAHHHIGFSIWFTAISLSSIHLQFRNDVE